MWRNSTRKAPVNLRIDASKMGEDKWNVFEIGEWIPEEGDLFYIGLLKPEELETIYLDCFWLQLATE